MPVDPIIAGETYDIQRLLKSILNIRHLQPTTLTVIPSGASTVARFKPIEL